MDILLTIWDELGIRHRGDSMTFGHEQTLSAYLFMWTFTAETAESKILKKMHSRVSKNTL